MHIDIRGETFEEKPSKINLQTHFFLKGKSYSGKSKELRMNRVNAILQVAAEGFAEEPTGREMDRWMVEDGDALGCRFQMVSA